MCATTISSFLLFTAIIWTWFSIFGGYLSKGLVENIDLPIEQDRALTDAELFRRRVLYNQIANALVCFSYHSTNQEKNNHLCSLKVDCQ